LGLSGKICFFFLVAAQPRWVFVVHPSSQETLNCQNQEVYLAVGFFSAALFDIALDGQRSLSAHRLHAGFRA
jgi:hypothetical protein